MFSFIQRFFRTLIRKSTYIHHESINKTSIIILVLVDVFVLFNVFSGLNSISQWPLSPQEEFPCYLTYENYQKSKQKGDSNFNATTIESIINENNPSSLPLDSRQLSRLGKVSNLCDSVIRLTKEINSKENVKLKASINQDRIIVSRLSQDTQTLRRQYDSTLLEKIAGQPSQKSINQTSADLTKSKIDANNTKVAIKKKSILEKQAKLLQQPSSQEYLKQLNNISDFKDLQKKYKSAQFWYPNKQLLLQTVFLLPLIALAYFVNTSATKKNKGVVSLISWHLLVIFCIPLLIKFFEFIQFGNLLGVVIEWLIALLGGLLFIASYLLILIIPLAGFGIIKFLQKFVFNPKVQARNRIQNVRCINCNFKLITGDEFCPSCGFSQFVDCSNCHQKTYKFTNFCKHCGHKLAQTL